MHKRAALLVTTIIAATTLAGCGGDSEYCSTVKDNQSVLDSVGTKTTDEAYTTYARALRSIAKVAPADARKDWTRLATATQGVLRAHRDADIALQDMAKPDRLAAVDATQREAIEKSYDRFNRASSKQGKRIKDSVKSECDVELQ